MSSHPVNLAIAFTLELAALFSFGAWGWHQGEGGWRFVLALGLPILFATLWGVFRVPGDPGPAPVAIPGILRLVFELAAFSLAVWALFDIGSLTLGWIFGVVFVLHYLTSYDHILWLIAR